jgi:hypothetical protein
MDTEKLLSVHRRFRNCRIPCPHVVLQRRRISWRPAARAAPEQNLTHDERMGSAITGYRRRSTEGPPNRSGTHPTACPHTPAVRRIASRCTRRFSAGPSYGTRSGAEPSWAAHDSSPVFPDPTHVLRTAGRQRAATLRRAEELSSRFLLADEIGRRAAPKAVPLGSRVKPAAERRAKDDALDAGLRAKHRAPEPLHDQACAQQNPS